MMRFHSDYDYLFRRNKTFVYRRVIPEHLRKLAGKSEFKTSLKTKLLDEAIARYRLYDDIVNAQFAKLRVGQPILNDQDMGYDAYAARATALGYQLTDLNILVNNPAELLEKVKHYKHAKKPSAVDFGTHFNASSGRIRLSKLVENYQDDQVHILSKLTEHEISKKISPLKNAVKKFQQYLGGDLALEDITRAQAKGFQTALKTKIAADEISSNTASKYITHLRTLIRCYHDHYDLGEDTIFDKINFTPDKNRRPTFTVEFLKERWFQGDPFATLNDCAKNLLFAVVDTGCSFKELCGLDSATDIVLSHDIPHIVIRENANRKLKTSSRERMIPLVGYSLQAFQAYPQGFVRYATGSGPSNASAVVNKYLKTNGLLETDTHSVYGLRHTFKDRLRAHGITGEQQDYLMGHKSHGMGAHYGNGYTLTSSLKVMNSLAKDWS